MKRKPNPDLVQALKDLRAWADLENRTSGTKEARKAWRDVMDWADGTAQKLGIEFHEIRTTPN